MNSFIRYSSPFATAALIGLAFFTGWAYVGFNVLNSIHSQWNRDAHLASHVESLRFTPDGLPVIASSRIFDLDSPKRLFDLNREPIELVKTISGTHVAAVEDDAWPAAMRVDHRVREIAFSPRFELWYLVCGPDGTTAWLEGFDRRSLKRVGYISRDGYSSTPPTPKQQFSVKLKNMLNFQRGTLAAEALLPPTRSIFEVTVPMSDRPMSEDVLLLANDGLCRIDLQKRTVAALLSDLAVESMEVVPVGTPEEGVAESSQRAVLIRTKTSLVLLEKKPGSGQLVIGAIGDSIQHEFPQPEEIRSKELRVYFSGWDRVSIAVTAPLPPPYDQPINRYDHRILQLAEGGAIESDVSTWTTHQYYGLSLIASRSLAIVAVPVPLLDLALITFLRTFEPFVYGGANASLAQRMAVNFSYTWPGLLVVAVLTLASAAWLVRHRAKHKLPFSWSWVMFVLLLGPCGLAGYLLHRPWPTKQVVPAPQLTGTEVFA